MKIRSQVHQDTFVDGIIIDKTFKIRMDTSKIEQGAFVFIEYVIQIT